MNFLALKKTGISALFTFLPLFSAFIAGCFNEPEPAYKSVPAENLLYLQGRGLKDISSIPVNPKASYLNLDRNAIVSIDGVEKFVGLKWLRLNENRLSRLPDLKPLVKLRRIYLRDNAFTEVPSSLKDLPELTDIDLSGNPVQLVPDWLATKKGLKNLSFSRTKLVRLPLDLSAWKSLQSLQLGDLHLSAEEMARIRAALPSTRIVF